MISNTKCPKFSIFQLQKMACSCQKCQNKFEACGGLKIPISQNNNNKISTVNQFDKNPKTIVTAKNVSATTTPSEIEDIISFVKTIVEENEDPYWNSQSLFMHLNLCHVFL